MDLVFLCVKYAQGADRKLLHFYRRFWFSEILRQLDVDSQCDLDNPYQEQ